MKLKHLAGLVLFLFLVVINEGGWCPGTSCWDVPVCQHTQRDDKGPCILHNAISHVWCGASAHSEPTCHQRARSCRLMYLLGLLTRNFLPLIVVLCPLSNSWVCFWYFFYCNFPCTIQFNSTEKSQQWQHAGSTSKEYKWTAFDMLK